MAHARADDGNDGDRVTALDELLETADDARARSDRAASVRAISAVLDLVEGRDDGKEITETERRKN
jgi:hypothetical protein